MENKKLMLNALEEQMYVDYKTKEYSQGRVPKEFEQWKESLGDDNLRKNVNKEVKIKPLEAKKEELFECTVCKESKTKDKFYNSKTSKNGIESFCKACRLVKNKESKNRSKQKVKTVNKTTTTKQDIFTLTKEELIEFGKECFKRGKHSNLKLDNSLKDELLEAICG